MSFPRRALAGLCVLAACSVASPLLAAPHIKTIKFAVTNPADTVRDAEDVVVPVPGVKRVAPDFNPGLIVVTVTDAATIDEDTAILHAEEVPSQIDDLDGDGKADEVAFQIHLNAKQTRVVTIAYGDAATIMRLRADYPAR